MGGVKKAVEKIEKTGQNLIDNPLPVIETVALVSVGVDPATASAAVSAANGGKVEDIAKSYVAGAVGSEVGGSVGEPGSITSGAAGGAASGATKAALTGKDIVEGATTGGIVGGGTSAAMTGIKDLTSEPVAGTGLKGNIGEGTSLASPTQPGTGLTNALPTTGGQGLYGDPNVILPASLGQYGTAPSQQKAGDTGLVPRTTSAADTLLPESLASYQTDYSSSTQSRPMEQTTLSPSTQSALKSVIGSSLSQLFAPSPSAGQRTPTYTPDSGVTSGTTVGLTGERGAGEIEGQGTGGKRKDVWNEASLRLKDALGI
jgi:hypothetical protein